MIIVADQLLTQARLALKTGDKSRARALCQDALRLNPRNYMAWLTMAAAAPSPDAAMGYVRQAERIQPDNHNVQKGLIWANKRLVTQETAVSTPITLEKKRNKRPFVFLVILIALLGTAAFAYLRWGQDGTTTVAMVVESTPISAAATIPPSSAEPQTAVQKTATPHTIQPKNISAGSKTETWATWTTTPTPTNTPTPTSTWQPTFLAPQEGVSVERPLGIGRYEKWIDVDLTSQMLTAYEGDALVFQTLISSGLSPNDTVTGQFRVWLRFESQTMDGSLLGYDYYLEGVPYVMYFFEGYALHGTFWHNNFGNPMSHGCVNMETGDAGWIFEWSTMGTVVNVHY